MVSFGFDFSFWFEDKGAAKAANPKFCMKVFLDSIIILFNVIKK